MLLLLLLASTCIVVVQGGGQAPNSELAHMSPSFFVVVINWEEKNESLNDVIIAPYAISLSAQEYPPLLVEVINQEIKMSHSNALML